MKYEPLFKIDFEHWSLPVSTETGLPTEPVDPEDFEGYSYWSPQYRGPIRQIRTKNRRDYYGDVLDTASGTLSRGVIGMMDVEPHDTEISKEQWEQQCQRTLMTSQYDKLVNNDVIVPLLSWSLSHAYFRIGEEPFIKRGDQTFRLNASRRALEPTKRDLQFAHEIPEHEYHYLSLSALINLYGKDEIVPLEPFVRRRVPFTIESVSYIPCENCEAHAMTAPENTSYTCQHCGHVGECTK